MEICLEVYIPLQGCAVLTKTPELYIHTFRAGLRSCGAQLENFFERPECDYPSAGPLRPVRLP